MSRQKPWVIFDVDGVLLDVRPSFYAIIRKLSGCTLADIALFKAHGGYNDDWELARAMCVWITAGRPKPLPEGGWRRMINQYGRDPGDLSRRCARMYRDTYWREEAPLLDKARLDRLAAVANVAACTGRNREELAMAQELLGFTFPHATTAEDVRKPDPQALLRLAPRGYFFGDTEDDRRCAAEAGFVYHHVTDTPVKQVDALLARLEFGEAGGGGDA